MGSPGSSIGAAGGRGGQRIVQQHLLWQLHCIRAPGYQRACILLPLLLLRHRRLVAVLLTLLLRLLGECRVTIGLGRLLCPSRPCCGCFSGCWCSIRVSACWILPCSRFP